jgi:hypothetical protein
VSKAKSSWKAAYPLERNPTLSMFTLMRM